VTPLISHRAVNTPRIVCACVSENYAEAEVLGRVRWNGHISYIDTGHNPSFDFRCDLYADLSDGKAIVVVVEISPIRVSVLLRPQLQKRPTLAVLVWPPASGNFARHERLICAAATSLVTPRMLFKMQSS